NLPEFEDRLLLHSHLPHWLGMGVVRVLPWLELTCGLCLALGYATREAALIGAFMLASFTVYLLAFAGETPCPCFLFPRAESAALPSWVQLLRNGLLLLAAAWLAWKYPDDRGKIAEA